MKSGRTCAERRAVAVSNRAAPTGPDSTNSRAGIEATIQAFSCASLSSSLNTSSHVPIVAAS